ncbi:MAG: M14 family metallopeptidase, partial [Pirellula sp.]|nr:M14 family metallopeptidase [Pirellula sp.]
MEDNGISTDNSAGRTIVGGKVKMNKKERFAPMIAVRKVLGQPRFVTLVLTSTRFGLLGIASFMLVATSFSQEPASIGAATSSTTIVAKEEPSSESVSAQDVKVQAIYKAVGGPTSPKVPVYWNRYHDNEEIESILKQLEVQFPSLVKIESVGKSTEGREMWIATITNREVGQENRKPGFWIDGGIHANEIQANEVALYTAWFLAEMHGENKFVQELLRQRVFYILPNMSPDSRHAHFYEPNSTNTPRSGQREVDDDRDGKMNEDAFADLNGDGHITQMRIKDPNGRFKSHPKYGNLMVPVEPGERGEFTLLGLEGFDVDGDGRVNEDGDGTYDPNRDWPWKWEPGYVQRGAFRYPFSLIENRNMAEFVLKHPNIAGAQTYHNTGGMLLRGPGSKQDAYEAADLRVYDRIGKTGEKILPGYRYLNVANDLYEVWGGEIDWFHQMLGVFTFTNELFVSYNYFHQPSGSPEQSHEFDQLLLFGDGLVEWQEVEHPTYGIVEVGGFKKNWGRQPPGFMLQE